MKNNWKKIKLLEITDVRDGTHDTPKPSLNGKFLITSKHIKGGKIDISSAYKISIDDYNFINKRSKVDQWDILISMIGTVGEICLVSKYPDFAIKNVGLIKTKNKHLARYLYYYLKSPIAQNDIKARLKGTTQQYLSLEEIRNFPIKLPPLETQKKIAKVLSALDDKIELNNKINENLEQQAQALFNKYFPCINIGNNFIGNYIKVKRGKNLLSKDAVLGKVPVVAGGLQPATYHNVSNTGAPVITISASGANAGYINLWHIPVWSSDSSFIDNSVSENIYFWFVLLKNRQQEIYDSQTGSAQPHIYPQHIENLPIGDIDKKLVTKYNKIVSPLFKLIGENKIENELLANLRDTLLPKLMNGEIDVEKIKI